MRRVDFARINAAALSQLAQILPRWLPAGRRRFREYVALNPKRHDRRMGSFSINLTTGRWSDFATGDKGGDPIALAAFLFDLEQRAAALKVAAMLGLDPFER